MRSLDAYWARELDEHLAVAAETRRALREDFARLVEVCARAFADGHKLMIFGNGGSAADAQHIASEFSVRYRADRRALPAMALTAEAATLTAAGNDLGFERVFARQIEALGRPGDIAMGISTSGRSRNVLQGLSQARGQGLVPVALGGGDGGELRGVADPCLIVPSPTVARIQEMHLTLGQMLCGAVEIALGLAGGEP
ncbi:MAG: SIS domain-containing protein [Alphaproteobacteria bacterium]|nr:SIS domain-containing protein [Alphaproteobacteria bacterium]MCW5740888.1 SIS domain-containing protein [Alphaproteobacteria bacterium]